MKSVLRTAREARGMTQEMVAKVLGMHVSAYGKKELGQRPITISEARTLSELLGVSPDVLFFDDHIDKTSIKKPFSSG